MAYDIFRKTQIPENFARGDAPLSTRSFVIKVLELCIVGTTIVLPEIIRQRENEKIRKDFSEEPYQVRGRNRVLHTTIETPAVPMSDLIYGQES